MANLRRTVLFGISRFLNSTATPARVLAGASSNATVPYQTLYRSWVENHIESLDEKGIKSLIAILDLLKKKYVGLLANVVNYTKMFTNETENEKKRVALTLQTIRGSPSNVTLAGKFADKFLAFVNKHPSEARVIIYMKRCLLCDTKVFEKFAGNIEAISNIEVCSDESIESSEQTSVPISRSLKRSFQKIDDVDEAIEHIAKRLHNVNIDDDKN
ncbi:hypothetical protein LXL04_020615 [Taraxacum kok-saghyz]